MRCEGAVWCDAVHYISLRHLTRRRRVRRRDFGDQQSTDLPVEMSQIMVSREEEATVTLLCMRLVASGTILQHSSLIHVQHALPKDSTRPIQTRRQQDAMNAPRRILLVFVRRPHLHDICLV